MLKETNTTHITEGADDYWTCVCGNEVTSDGFYACDTNGDQVEPTPEEWKEPLYVCPACSRIIHQQTLGIVGRNPTARLF
jgi:hypothetical protein